MPEAPKPTEGKQTAPASVVVRTPPYLIESPSLANRVARGSLIFLAVVVAAGLILIVLPQSTVERMIHGLQATKAADLPPEKIALLYLGDEMKGKEFHIRGIVRNISSEPLQKLDATVRLYSTENTLLETVVVRMDQDVIPADATAEFHLTYPNFMGQFGTYSVDFKWRGGELVPYKDRRGTKFLK